MLNVVASVRYLSIIVIFFRISSLHIFQSSDYCVTGLRSQDPGSSGYTHDAPIIVPLQNFYENVDSHNSFPGPSTLTTQSLSAASLDI